MCRRVCGSQKWCGETEFLTAHKATLDYLDQEHVQLEEIQRRGRQLVAISKTRNANCNASVVEFDKYKAAKEDALKLFSKPIFSAGIFSLGKLKVFEDVSGQHMIFRVTKARSKSQTLIKLVAPTKQKTAQGFVEGSDPVIEFRYERTPHAYL